MSKERERKAMEEIIVGALDEHTSFVNALLVSAGGNGEKEKELRGAILNAMLTACIRWEKWLAVNPSFPPPSKDNGVSVRAEDLRKIAPAIRKGAASISEQADFAEQRLGGIIGSAAADSLRKDAADMNSLAAFVANLAPAEEKE